jgi:hypothetical protein
VIILLFLSFKVLKTTNQDSAKPKLVVGENGNPCKYCRSLHDKHYHKIDGKLYLRDNYLKTGKMCDLCHKYSVHKITSNDPEALQLKTHVHIID